MLEKRSKRHVQSGQDPAVGEDSDRVHYARPASVTLVLDNCNATASISRRDKFASRDWRESVQEDGDRDRCGGTRSNFDERPAELQQTQTGKEPQREPVPIARLAVTCRFRIDVSN